MESSQLRIAFHYPGTFKTSLKLYAGQIQKDQQNQARTGNLQLTSIKKRQTVVKTHFFAVKEQFKTLTLKTFVTLNKKNHPRGQVIVLSLILQLLLTVKNENEVEEEERQQ